MPQGPAVSMYFAQHGPLGLRFVTLNLVCSETVAHAIEIGGSSPASKHYESYHTKFMKIS